MNEQLTQPSEHRHEKTEADLDIQPEMVKHHERQTTPQISEEIEHPKRHELAKTAKTEAKGSHETPIGEEHQQASPKPVLGLQRELKTKAYDQSLQKIRSHLKPVERAFSKVVHQPFVESASEITGKTALRPSGILGGGIVALLGSGFVLYISKHYGFRYNFFVFILLFIGGFAAGLFAELLLHYARPKQDKDRGGYPSS